jgi:hypothetical protein
MKGSKFFEVKKETRCNKSECRVKMLRVEMSSELTLHFIRSCLAAAYMQAAAAAGVACTWTIQNTGIIRSITRIIVNAFTVSYIDSTGCAVKFV